MSLNFAFSALIIFQIWSLPVKKEKEKENKKIIILITDFFSFLKILWDLSINIKDSLQELRVHAYTAI